MSNNVKLEIADFLGYCDMNGVDALDSAQVEKLENFIFQCNQAMNNADGTPLVADAIYDRLVEILKQVNPDAEILGQVWSDDVVPMEEVESEDVYRFLRQEPMRSICTCKSYDCQELQDFVKRLPADRTFDAHVSFKENGHGIRIVYCWGTFESATSRARNSAGRDLTKQLGIILANAGLDNIEALSDYEVAEIRGEVLLPLSNLDTARSYNKDIVSAFSGVSSMLRDSATREETSLLHFVAYKLFLDGIEYSTKEEEYQLLEQLGFTVPTYWIIPDLSKETLLDDLPGIVEECEAAIHPEDGEDYDYYTDGLVFEINDRELFNELGSDGKKYNYGNVALKVGYWRQDLYSGYIQTIMWTDGKTKYSPVAIVGEEPFMAVYTEDEDPKYIVNQSQIDNWKKLGVVTAGGNKVRRVPLYEPNNMLMLNAYPGEVLHFRYGGEAGVVPCFPDGTPLANAKVRSMFEVDEYEDTDNFGVW